MERVDNYRTLILGALVILVALISYYVIGSSVTKLILDVMVLGAAVVVGWTWAPAAFNAFRRGGYNAADKIILTVWISWITLLTQRGYVLTLSILGRPTWLLESPVPIVITAMILIAGAYASYATIAESEVPVQERRHILFATFLGGLVVGAALSAALIFGFTF